MSNNKRSNKQKRSKKSQGIFAKYRKYLFSVVTALLVFTQWDFLEETWFELIDVLANQQTTDAPSDTGFGKDNKNEDDSTISFEDFVKESEQLPTDKDNTPNSNNSITGKKESIKLVSWNLLNMGVSKDDDEVEFIAKILKNYDVVALQEVATKISGPRAIAKLNEELNRTGARWDYVVSDATSGAGAERYVYMWKTAKVSLASRPWLVTARGIADKIDREPFMARFKLKANEQQTFLVGNFHAVPASKTPQKEIVLLDELHDIYRKDNLVIAGDFNLSEKQSAFDELKREGYSPVVVNQKTSLKMKKNSTGEYLAREYDNIFYETAPLRIGRSGIVDFVPRFKDLKSARKISDHLPVWCELQWN